MEKTASVIIDRGEPFKCRVPVGISVRAYVQFKSGIQGYFRVIGVTGVGGNQLCVELETVSSLPKNCPQIAEFSAPALRD